MGKIVAFVVIMGVLLCLVSVYSYFYNSTDDVSVQFVSKTEYVAGDIGQVIVELRNAQNNVQVVLATCLATVWYPNKSVFLANQSMANASSGSKYINFTVPSSEGTYEYQVMCSYNNKQYIQSSSFHVSSGFRQLQSDIRQNLQIESQGVDQVQLGKGAKNSWKFFSPFMTTIYNASCVVNQMDVDTLLSFSDNFNRPDSSVGVIGGGWSYNNNSGGSPLGSYPYGLISSNVYRTYNPDNINGVQWSLIEQNVSFVPALLWAKVNTLAVDGGNAYSEWYFSIFFYNSSNEVYGKVQLRSYYSGFGFNNCGALSPPDGDPCGNIDACVGTSVCKTYSLSPVVQQTNVSENIIDLIGSVFDPFAASYVKIRYAVQGRQSYGTKFQTSLDDFVVLAQPFGTEFVDNQNDVFGFNWTASRDVMKSWRNVEVQCAAVFDNNGQMSAQQVKQYVYITNDDRIKAVTPK